MKRDQLEFPKRTVHLDFHTGPDIPDVGRDFNALSFARTFKEAHIDSVTLFAMCHHGHLYYDTSHPARHPGLSKSLNLLEEQQDALHSLGIRSPIYLSVQCNEFAANEHPEWIALTSELQQVKWGSSAYEAGWQILDMSSPYQDYLAEILNEVLQKFTPVDGIFLDMCWDQPSSSKWAMDGMRKSGYDPRNLGDRSRYARETAHSYMARYRDMVEQAQRNHKPTGIWFNSRPKTNLNIEKKFLRHVEIEALPTGGWGYAYFPYVSRFVQHLNLPTLSHTGRFFKSWGDNSSLKPEMALKYECCQILSQGMTNGVGDLLHPRGMLSKSVYDLIGGVFAHIEACESYVEGGRLLSQIAVVIDAVHGDKPGPSGLGVTRALQQLQQQFSIVPMDVDLVGYELVIIPELTRINEELKLKLERFLSDGGALIVCGPAVLDDDGNPVMKEFGISTHGPSPFKHTFLHATPAVSIGLADYGYVMYEKGFRMTPETGTESLVAVGEPYFEREYDKFSGHEYTSEVHISSYSATVRKGKVITFSVPILEAYGLHAAPNYRILLGNCIDLLLINPLVRAKGPSKLETTVLETSNGLLVHLLSFISERRAEGLDIVEDVLPLVNMPISVRFGHKPSRVFLAPEEVELPFDYKDGYIQTRINSTNGHSILVIQN